MKGAASIVALCLLPAGNVHSQQSSPEEFGPNPELAAPEVKWLPTLHIATPKGWGAYGMPQAAPGTVVMAVARGLKHPRWLYVLPNGDILVAESDAPARPDDGKGLRGKIGAVLMKRAGSGAKLSANQITLLRDVQGDGARVPQ